MTKYAALDIGSNSTILLVVAADSDKQARCLHDLKYTTRLANYVNKEGLISDEGIASQFHALEQAKKQLDHDHVKEVAACGTDVFRTAKNGREIAKKISEKFGWRVEIISGEDEAQLSFRAATTGIDIVAKEKIIADIGGGSTEIILGDADQIVRATTFPIGVVDFAETVPLGSVVRHEVHKRIVQKIAAEIQREFGG